MNTTYKVTFWEIKKRGGQRKRPYAVRWLTDGQEHSEWFANKAHASGRLSELTSAAHRGEPFDIESGLPVSELRRRSSCSFLDFAQRYLDMKWTDAAAKTRASLVDALTTATAAHLRPGVKAPCETEVRRVLVSHLLPPTTRQDNVTPDDRNTATWIGNHSLPLHGLTDTDTLRKILDAFARKLDGTPTAATVYRRKRAVLFNLLSYAVELELLTENPLLRVKRATPKHDGEVDPRVVANPRQVQELLTSTTYVGSRNQERGAHLSAFFAVMYYAAARPAEAIALRDTDCKLPDSGWGELALGHSRPAAGKRWTDSGQVHDRRGLKHRARNTRRFVPIPPTLVRILREHIDRYGVGAEGRLFCSPNGAVVGSSTYTRVWREARRYALNPDQVASPLAGRPYDLRHAAVSLWLNGGVDPTEVAERAGHSLDVLYKVYAKCIYGQRDKVNSKIEGLYDA